MKEYKPIVTRYPAVRQFTADTVKLSRHKHIIRALLEVDVTNALGKLKAARAPGKKISFLAWFIHILGVCVAKHPPIDGVLWKKHSAITYKDIDLTTIVEKQVDGKGVPIPLIIREVNNKTPMEINGEIQSAIQQDVRSEKDYVLGDSNNDILLRLAVAVPQWIRVLFMRCFILRNPKRVKKMMGTVSVTSLGTQGRIAGWILPTSIHPLSIGIGSLTKKAAIYKGEIQKRDILHLTIAIDHNVIDGMPAMRFVDELVSMLEAGSGLEAFSS